jgi:hypothetical protein
MSAEFQAPPTDMVRVVRNIIESYKMGPLRALAQDPVQNALDAAAGGGPVSVEYRVHGRQLADDTEINLLTVTDAGTTGLRGAPLSLRDLQERAFATGQIELTQDENWAAWEAMGYTKTGENKLGSRGQGKAAFLYHSRRALGITTASGLEIENMLMLYDTLLPDGTYRLGVRIARPADLVLYPPFDGDAARAVVAGGWTSPDGQLNVPLQLPPLERPGSRIIVPFLSDEAVQAFQDGTMLRWLERCWWRAVQIKRLEIRVITDQGETEVEPPTWWGDEPWRQNPLPQNVFVSEHIAIEADSDRKIKRIVLIHDPSLRSDEIHDVAASQYAGVQLLRGQQWIETLGTRDFADYIPSDARDGFRGFVEFDERLEGELREIESPQHDAFHRHRAFVRQIALVVDEAVEEFGRKQGWVTAGDVEPQEDRTADDVLRQVTELFITGGAVSGRGDRDIWTCKLDVEYPADATTRVEWGESLTSISAVCRHSPGTDRRDVRFDLVVIDPMGDRVLVESRSQQSTNSSAGADFQDVRFVKIRTDTGDVASPMLGRYRLRVECFVEDERVVTASRNVYVRMDAPEPPEQRPITVAIELENADSNQRRVNDGEHLNVALVVKNRSATPVAVTVVASLGPLLLHDDEVVELPARLAGDQPPSQTLTTPGLEVVTSGETDALVNRVALEPGPTALRVDVYDLNGAIVASASKLVWVEQDPDDGGPDLPFELRPRESTEIPLPAWELEAPHGEETKWVLYYARSHPLFRARAERNSEPGLSGRRLFFCEMICGGLVEWALTLFREGHDESGFQTLVDQAKQVAGPLWERYHSRLEELRDEADDPLEAMRKQRDVVSLMLYVMQGSVIPATEAV